MQKLFSEEPVLIKVTRLDGTEVVLNSDLIEFVQSTPDTVISLTNNKKMTVRESIEEVLEKIVEYKRHICGQSWPSQSDQRGQEPPPPIVGRE
jgi:flagellar protein FlbD